MKELDGYNIIKWILVIPVVVVAYFFAGFFGKIALSMIIGPSLKHHQEAAFIINHIVNDTFCLALGIMSGITLAPSRKTAVAVFLLILSLLTDIKYIVPVIQGNHSFNACFVVATHFAGGLIPLLIVLANNWINRDSLVLPNGDMK